MHAYRKLQMVVVHCADWSCTWYTVNKQYYNSLYVKYKYNYFFLYMSFLKSMMVFEA